jgi:AcrR family transcriptional regulator
MKTDDMPVERVRDAGQTRERILTAARREFAQLGFTAARVHDIARTAGVSPNLITRYFGGKDGLFVAAADVRLQVDRMFDGPRETLGQRMADTIVTRWTSIRGDDPLLLLLRASGERQEAASALAGFLDRESFEPLRRQLLLYGMSAQEAGDRALAVDVFLIGVSMRRRVLRDDTGSPDELATWLAHAIQRLVDGD